ncbi:MAG: FecR family protein [Tannerellaceae bacterium]|jgi:ferric-dicitrate binding protein FerR (iron transport regulator)|nr:FecR family protein [Tannerellaceae bacterium]
MCKKMTNKYLSLLITSFFENKVSKEVQQKFHNWFVESESQPEKRDVMLDVWENYTQNTDEQTAEALEKIQKRIHLYENSRQLPFYRRLAKVAVVLLFPILSALLAYHFKPDTLVVREPEFVEYFVPRGERRHIILPDGSEVWVNAGSVLISEKEFLGATRTLYLNGEANFSVAFNPDKPFIVKTEYMDIMALGTIFNVQSYSDAEKTITTLESGKIQISTRHTAMQSVVILSPNEQLIYDRAADEFITKKVIAGKNTQWIQGFMVFQSSTFEEIARVIERKFQVNVQYDPNKFKGRIFTVRFSPDEGIKQVFDILKDIGGFTYKIKENIVYVK